MRVIKQDVTDAAGTFNLSAGQKAGVEADPSVVLKAFRDLNRGFGINQEVVEEVLGVDLTPLAKYGVISSTNEGWTTPYRLDPKFSAINIEGENSGRYHVRISGGEYQTTVLGDYCGVNMDLRSPENGVSFMRIMHPNATDDASSRCVIAEIRIAGLTTSIHHTILLNGWSVESALWSDMPAYTEDSDNPYFPRGENSWEYLGKMEIEVKSIN